MAHRLDRCALQLRGAVETPRPECEWIVAHVLSVERSALWRAPERPLTAEQVRRIDAAVARRATGEPLDYILGVRSFYGRDFRVTPAVLVPRPETEELVERVLRGGWGDATHGGPPRGRWLDVGTGSGAIAITLACEMPSLDVLAVDRSPEALDVAQSNARRLAARVTFIASDLLSAFDDAATFDGVIANLPYIPKFEYDRLDPTVLRFEPRMALTPAGESVEAMRRRLVADAARRLRRGGRLVLEVGAGQAGQTRDDLLRAGLRAVRVCPDLAGIGRVVTGTRHADGD